MENKGQGGGRNENPNIQQCMVNAAALRIQGSVALDPVRGNCRRKRHMEIDESSVIGCPPLPKRKRSNHKKKSTKVQNPRRNHMQVSHAYILRMRVRVPRCP